MTQTRLTVDFLKSFAGYKPKEDYAGTKIRQMISSGRLINIFRKRDGWRVRILIDQAGRVFIFSANGKQIQHKVPYIVDQIRQIGFGPNTLLDGEIIVQDRDKKGMDNRGLVASVLNINGSVKDAEAIQRKHGRAKLVLFAMYFNRGDNLSGTPYDQMLKLLRDKIFFTPVSIVTVAETLYIIFEDACKVALDFGWEGLVVYANDFPVQFTTDGKVDRPEGCYKWKPESEDDFFVRPESLKFNPDGQFRSAILLQKDPHDPSKEYDCYHLSGFPKDAKAFVSTIKRPVVVQVRFESRNDENGKIRIAKFVEFRDSTDKPYDQCLAPESYPDGVVFVKAVKKKK